MKIALVGEAWGQQEEFESHREGKPCPFVGGAGQVLDHMLSDAGLRREEVTLHNLVDGRPAPNSNDFSLLYKDPRAHREGKSWEPSQRLVQELERLHHELTGVNPNVIVPLGNEPLYWLCNKHGISKWRGSILPATLGLKAVPTFHPAYIMRQYADRPLAVCDLVRAKEQSAFAKIELPEREFLLKPTYNQVLDYLEHLMKYTGYVSFDIETRSNQIACIALAGSAKHAICIPFMIPHGNYWPSAADEYDIWEELATFFREYSGKLIAQNYHFDRFYLEQMGVPVGEIWMDLMLAHNEVYCELRHKLPLISSIHSLEPYYKEEGREWEPGMAAESLWQYNCKDACVTFECAMDLEQEMKELGVDKRFHEYVMPLSDLLYKMTMTGIAIDTGTRDSLKTDLKSQWDFLQRKMEYAIGYPMNVKSSKQVQKFLYEDLGLPKQLKERKGGELTATTDEEHLWDLYSKFPSNIFKAILQIRGLRHKLENWLGAEIDGDGRMRTSLVQRTKTGRLGSSKTVWGSGFNLQNLPRD